MASPEKAGRGADASSHDPVDSRESIEISAPAERVYDLVADVARMGEWSPEATGARGATRALQAGDGFWGTNRRGPFLWATRCSVLVADRGRMFQFDVDFAMIPLSRWTYHFAPTDSGCVVTETWLDRRSGPTGIPVKLSGQLLIPGSRPEHNASTMRVTLERLKAAAEEEDAPASE